MRSYDEIYRNVLRRRDEQTAKKRRRIAVMGSVLPMAAVSIAVVIGVAVLQDKPLTKPGAASSGDDYTYTEETTLTFLCGTKHTTFTALSDHGGTIQWSEYDSSKLKPPAEVIDGRLIFTADGQHIDITGIISEQSPYIYETVNPGTELPDIFIVGGTPENFGWIENLMYDEYPSMPEQNHWISDSDNIYTETEEGVEYRDWCVNSVEQLRQNPRYTSISDSYIGGNSTVAAYSLNGYTASMRLIGVTHRPDADDENYVAWDAVLTVTDPEGRTAVTSVNAACELYGHFFHDKLNGNYIDKCLRIYRIEYGGEPHYVLALRRYFTDYPDDVKGFGIKEETEKYVLIFFALEEECFEDGQLRIYESGVISDPDPNYIVFAGDELKTEGNVLIDDRAEIPEVHFYEFDPENYFYHWHYEKRS